MERRRCGTAAISMSCRAHPVHSSLSLATQVSGHVPFTLSQLPSRTRGRASVRPQPGPPQRADVARFGVEGGEGSTPLLCRVSQHKITQRFFRGKPKHVNRLTHAPGSPTRAVFACWGGAPETRRRSCRSGFQPRPSPKGEAKHGPRRA